MEYKVTVIIPVFNGGKFVKRAVESALSLAEVGEILLIDDGSTDNTLQICLELAKKSGTIKVLQHPDMQNHGPAASRNLAIRHANFDFIAFLDADDYYLPNRFSTEKNIFQSMDEADGVYGCIQNVFESDQAKKLFYQNETEELHTVSEKLPPEKLFKALLFFGHGRICLPVITVKKKALFAVGLFNEQLRWSEDTELWLKLSVKSKLIAGDLEAPGCIRVVHSYNSTHNFEKGRYYKKKMYSYLFDWSVKQKLPFDTINSLFNAVLLYTKRKDFHPERLLFELIKENPKLLFHKFLWKKLHLLYYAKAK